MSTISIKKIGILSVGTECIVNAANEGLWGGGGVCGIIFKAAGSSQLTKACRAIGHCDTGNAVITPAFNIDAKYIIHAVGPVWNGGNKKEPQQLYGCYKRSLELAKENECHSIGFPLISSGIFGYPVDQAWKKALQACNDFINKNNDYDIDIVFAVIDDNVLDIGLETLNNIDKSHLKFQRNSSFKILPKDVALLKSIDREKLKAGIEYFCEHRTVDWNGGDVIGKTDEGKNIINWPHPNYTLEMWDYIQLFEPDKNYAENYKEFCENVLPTNMNVRQIRTMLTYVQRGEHFCDGFLSGYIKDGTILKYLLRLDDLLTELDYKENTKKD